MEGRIYLHKNFPICISVQMVIQQYDIFGEFQAILEKSSII